MIRFILTIAILGSLAAFVTKPSQERVEQILSDKIVLAISDRELNTNSDAGAMAATALCKIDPKACAKLILSGAQIEYVDQYLFASVKLSGFGKEARCYGVFLNLLCPGGDPTR